MVDWNIASRWATKEVWTFCHTECVRVCVLLGVSEDNLSAVGNSVKRLVAAPWGSQWENEYKISHLKQNSNGLALRHPVSAVHVFFFFLFYLRDVLLRYYMPDISVCHALQLKTILTFNVSVAKGHSPALLLHTVSGVSTASRIKHLFRFYTLFMILLTILWCSASQCGWISLLNLRKVSGSFREIWRQ